MLALPTSADLSDPRAITYTFACDCGNQWAETRTLPKSRWPREGRSDSGSNVGTRGQPMDIGEVGRSVPLTDDLSDDHLVDVHLINGRPVLDCADAVVKDALEERRSSGTDQVGAATALGLVARSLSKVTGEDYWVVTPIEEIVIGFMATISGMADTLSCLTDVAERQPHLFARPIFQRGTGMKRETADPLPADEAVKEACDFASKLRDIESALMIARAACDQIGAVAYLPDPGWRLAKAIEDGTVVDLYRWFDSTGRLLYIGITGSMADRQAAHEKGSSWWDFAETYSVERFPTRAEAETAERHAIEGEYPLFNSQYNNTPEARQRLVAYLVERDRHDLLQPAISRG